MVSLGLVVLLSQVMPSFWIETRTICDGSGVVGPVLESCHGVDMVEQQNDFGMHE
jgi:hypothetical protein